MTTTDEKLEALAKRIADYTLAYGTNRDKRRVIEARNITALREAVALARAEERALIERAVETLETAKGSIMASDLWLPMTGATIDETLAALRARLEGHK